jgi:hypothetical protein
MEQKRRVAADAPSANAKRAKKSAAVLRKASMDFGLCLQAAFRSSRGLGLKRSPVPAADRTKAFDDDLRRG